MNTTHDPNAEQQLWVLGTGGTIAGWAGEGNDHVGYAAGQVGIETLLAQLPGAGARPVRVEQVAQIDSKDLDFATWGRLATRVQALVDDPATAGVVVTHGTDTLEETAYLLHRVLRSRKPVVLTAAMRPANSCSPDGPQNLLDALCVARHPQAQGVVVVVQGAVHRGDRVRKVHSYRLDAFASEGGPLAWVENGALRQLAPWEPPEGLGCERLLAPRWPRVELLWNAVGSDGALLPLLQNLARQEGRRLGVVVAGTGNGSMSQALETALRRAAGEGVAVLRSTRCAAGAVVGAALGDAQGATEDPPAALPSAGALSPVQARVELLLQLLEAPAPSGP